MRQKRKIIAVRDGERMEFESTYAAARVLNTSTQNIALALGRNGTCGGWRLYDSPEVIRARIDDLQRQLDEVEGLV